MSARLVKSLSKVCTLQSWSETAQLRIGELSSAHGGRDRAAARLGTALRPADARRAPASGYRLYSTEDVAARRPDAAAARRRACPLPKRRARRSRSHRLRLGRRSRRSARRDRAPRRARAARRRRRARRVRPATRRATRRPAVLDGVVLPLLHELGDGWERGEISIAQEHFASNLLRGRLLGLARGWDRGSGPRAVLACPPGERHDLGLVIFGLALREHGWRITFLGADTPPETVVDTGAGRTTAAVVLALADSARLEVEAGLRGRSSPICPRRSGSAARERSPSWAHSCWRARRSRRRRSSRARARGRAGHRRSRGAESLVPRRRRPAPPPGAGRRCSSMPFRACRRRSREPRSGRRGAAPAAPRPR